MARLEIEYDEDIYEGKLYGWRWFIVAHGVWQVVPPMFSNKRSNGNPRCDLNFAEGGEEYYELLPNWLATIDLVDWNQSDIPPDLPRIAAGRTHFTTQSPVGHASGFHLFENYSNAVGYAIVPYAAKKCGLAIPRCKNFTTPGALDGHMHKSDPGDLRLKVTPLLAFVEASGCVVEHELGYRAHLIRVVSLYSDGRKRARATLADNIGWPGEIQKYRKLRSMENPTDTDLRRIDCD